MSDRLEAGHGVLVTVDGKRSQPDLSNDADLVAHLDRGDVSVHLSQNGGADGTLVHHGGVNAGNVANTDVVDILVGLGGVASGGHGSANPPGGHGSVRRADLQEVLDHVWWCSLKTVRLWELWQKIVIISRKL